MAYQPTSFELGQARKIVIRVNAWRRKHGTLVQRDELDTAAWQMALLMQKNSYQRTGGYPQGMTPVERVKKSGFPAKRKPVEKVAYKPTRGMWQSQEHLLERVVENWLADPTFATILRDGAYVWCGAAAHRDSYFVLLVAG